MRFFHYGKDVEWLKTVGIPLVFAGKTSFGLKNRFCFDGVRPTVNESHRKRRKFWGKKDATDRERGYFSKMASESFGDGSLYGVVLTG